MTPGSNGSHLLEMSTRDFLMIAFTFSEKPQSVFYPGNASLATIESGTYNGYYYRISRYPKGFVTLIRDEKYNLIYVSFPADSAGESIERMMTIVDSRI